MSAIAWNAAWCARTPCTVTAQYAITLKRPTPTDGDILIVARPVEVGEDRAVVEAELTAGGKVCATSRGRAGATP